MSAGISWRVLGRRDNWIKIVASLFEWDRATTGCPLMISTRRDSYRMNRLFLPPSFSTRLILGAFALILLTTLIAGIPAYWLTRAQLERQAWSQIDGAQRATRSLLLAEEDRLRNLATLFAERPTLQRLARQQEVTELGPYLEAFRQQSRLDLLLFCDADSRLVAGNVLSEACSQLPATGFSVFGEQPALVASQPVDDDTSGRALGTAIAGIWLDQPFLQQLAADTGVQQSIVAPEGIRLASSLSEAALAPPDRMAVEAISSEDRVVELGDSRYFAAYSPLPAAPEGAALLSEVALLVDDLIATERQALFILAGSTGLVALLGGMLGIWTMGQLLAPLQRLTVAAEEIGEGNFMAPIPLISQPAEISTLASALHHSQRTMLQALQERADARDWLDALIQSIVEGVVAVDGAGRITFLSHGAEQLSGWSQQEALGTPLDEIFQVTDEEGGGFLERVPPLGRKRQIQVRNRTGKKMVLAVTSAQLMPPGIETEQLALVLRDVTEEEALRHLRAYFLANISHEFLTPLSTLNASMELMLNPAENLSTEEMRQLLKPSYVSLSALQTLVNNLLASSSIEAGQFTLYQQPTDLNQVLENALRMVQPLLERRRQPLIVGATGLLPTLTADPARLTQALANLLVNASKYSPAGKPIDVNLVQQEQTLRVSVADRGPGIPPAERESIFRRFVRREANNGEQYGVGLGLFVVKTTIEAHGGRVGVDERPGGGSIFWFEVPLSPAEGDR